MTSDVEAVSRAKVMAILDNGEEIPVTNWFDDDGDDCAPGEASSAVAGPDSAGNWYAIDLSAFEPVVFN